MRDNEKEDARKRGGGADKRVGAHSRYQFFRCGKIGGGGRINDGGRSGGTLRYMRLPPAYLEGGRHIIYISIVPTVL